jgi:hypothetical protein
VGRKSAPPSAGWTRPFPQVEKVPAHDAVKPGATRRVLGDWQAQRVGCINILHDSVPSIGYIHNHKQKRAAEAAALLFGEDAQRLAEYAPFKTDESRANVVKDIKALGLRFVTDPPKPEISIPTVPLEALTKERVFAKFSDYLLSLVERGKS